MNRKKQTAIIFALIILLTILIIILYSMLMIEEKNNQTNDVKVGIVKESKEPTSIKEVLEKYNSKVISDSEEKIYVEFEKDLYDEKGKSNEDYFNKIIKESEKFVKNTVKIIDEEKKIVIELKLNDKEEYSSTINTKQEFFEETDGEDYTAIEKTEIVKATNMPITSPELQAIVISNMKTNKATSLGKKTSDEGDYEVYQDGDIKLKRYEFSSGRVKNMIFSKEYGSTIMSGVSKDYTLEEILDRYKEPAFGSIRDGYLGYRTPDVYVYFYKDEVSVYGYTYKFQVDFEEKLETYLQDKDLKTFARGLAITMDNYYEYKFNEEEQSLYISYPGRGIEIDIKNNDPKGITLYNNYYLTERTKSFLKQGIISINPDEDYIDKIEKERVGKN